MAILLLRVDGSDTDPIGVYRAWNEALAAAHADAFGGAPANEDDDDEKLFSDAFIEAFEPYQRAATDEGMDLQWEAGVGSWDYRLVHVEVFL